jgi:FeS assembly SUF system protein
MTEITKDQLKLRIKEILRNIFDPEIPVNIYELGLIYEINIKDKFNVHILMTLTSPNCPVAESMPTEVRDSIAKLPEVSKCEVELTFEPPWNQEMLSEEAKLELGFL